ncbi:MAG: hypothetical protein WCP85_16495 [Mariniphaga sp.]
MSTTPTILFCGLSSELARSLGHGAWRRENGDGKTEMGKRRMENGKWKIAGNWRLAAGWFQDIAGGWQLATGGWLFSRI